MSWVWSQPTEIRRVPSSPTNDQLAMYQNFSGIGLTTSGYTAPSPAIQTEMNQAAADAADMLQAMAANTSSLPGGGATSTNWTVNTTLGEYAATYDGWLTNTITADIGTVANLAVDGTYPQTTIDANGAALNGTNSYTMSFAAGDLPPVEGFWSVTVYDAAGYVVPNTGNTFYGDDVYSIGSMQMANVLGSALTTTPVTFYLQPNAPTDVNLMPFWLPVPVGQNFELLLRMYFPDSSDPSILNGTYSIPAVQLVPEPATWGLLAMAGAFIGLPLLARRKPPCCVRACSRRSGHSINLCTSPGCARYPEATVRSGTFSHLPLIRTRGSRSGARRSGMESQEWAVAPSAAPKR